MVNCKYINLDYLLNNILPQQTLNWDDVEKDISNRECLCCGKIGHYQKMLEKYFRKKGFNDNDGIYIGDNGRVKDGHHRVIVARKLKIKKIPLESKEEAKKRWILDHGNIPWSERKKGDK